MKKLYKFNEKLFSIPIFTILIFTALATNGLSKSDPSQLNTYSKTEIETLLQLQDVKLSSTVDRLQATTENNSNRLADLSSKYYDQESRLNFATSKFSYTEKWVNKQDNSIDRWLIVLTIITGIIAVCGAFLPYILTKRVKQDYLESLKRSEEALQNIEDVHSEIQKHLNLAKISTAKLDALITKASSDMLTTSDKTIIEETVGNKEASLSDRLIAKAVQAIGKKDYEQSLMLYKILYDEEPNKVTTNFGLAFSYQQLAEQNWKNKEETLLKAANDLYKKIIAANPTIPEAFNNLGNVILKQTKFASKNEAKNLRKNAYEKFEQALLINPNMSVAFGSWATGLSDEASSIPPGSESDKLYSLAYEKYEKSLSIDPKQYSIIVNYSTTLAKHGANKPYNEGKPLFEKAYNKINEALELTPDRNEAILGLAYIQTKNAKTASVEESQKLYKSAYQNFEKVLERDPNNNKAIKIWASELAEQFESSTGTTSNALFDLARQKYLLALSSNPKDQDLLNDLAYLIGNQAKRKIGQEADQLFSEAFYYYQQALKEQPQKSGILNNWGESIANQALISPDGKSQKLFTLSYEKFEEALSINPENKSALENWGKALADHAAILPKKEAIKLLELAIEKYTEASQLQPFTAETIGNLGIIRASQAKLQTGAEADLLFSQSYDCFKQAHRKNPTLFSILENWGRVLGNQAMTKTKEISDKIFQEAYDKYEQIQPNPSTLVFYASTIAAQASLKSGIEAEQLYQLAYSKIQKALSIDSNNLNPLLTWSTLLINRAKNLPTKKSTELYKEATDILLQAEKISQGVGSYNLACIASLNNDLPSCEKWLLNSKENNYLPPLRHIISDSDLDPVKKTKWFDKLIK